MATSDAGAELVRMAQSTRIDHKLAELHRLVAAASEEARKDYFFRLDVSWIHHDSALEGVVYSIPELAAVLGATEVPDPASIPGYDEIRQNKAAIDLVREMARRKRLKIDLDVLKDLYLCLAPEELEGKKPPAYRKDIPLHRLYFHEIAPPAKISYRLRQFTQWVNAAETRRSTHTVRLAAKAHYQLLHIYPFPKHSGKIARLVMNLLLLHGGYPPAVIHATERQRYYDALKTSDDALAKLSREALIASMDSAARFFEALLPPVEEVAKPRAKRKASVKKKKTTKKKTA